MKIVSFDHCKISKLMLQHPALIADQKDESLKIRGFIEIQGSVFNIYVNRLKNSKLYKICVHIHNESNGKNIESFSVNADSKENVDQIINNLFNSINNIVNKNLMQRRILNTLEQHNVFREIGNLYEEHTCQIIINDSHSHIRLHKFQQYEGHFLEVKLPSLLVCNHSLPDGAPWEKLLQKANTLTNLVNKYRKYLSDLEPFYNCFAEIDELCSVVQPKPITMKHNWRLFLLRKHVYLKLTISDPISPFASMSMDITGPTHKVEQLRVAFGEGIRNWDSEINVHKNLLRIFDLCFFPLAEYKDYSEEYASEKSSYYCNICYCYQLDNGDIPMVSCDNDSCNLIFHELCLQSWFKTLANNIIFLDVSLGICPFCKTKLSTSFVKLM